MSQTPVQNLNFPDLPTADRRAQGTRDGEQYLAALEWRAILPPDVYAVTRQHGTERAWSGVYNDEKRKGVYA